MALKALSQAMIQQPLLVMFEGMPLHLPLQLPPNEPSLDSNVNFYSIKLMKATTFNVYHQRNLTHTYR